MTTRSLNTDLLAAVRARDVTLAERLLGTGADAGARDRATGLTALMIAAGQADAETAAALVAAGADVLTADTGAGATALHKACQGGSVEVVRILVEAGAFIDSVAPTTGHTPLMDALWFKFPEVARYLLDHGAGLNLSTHYGFSLQEHFAYELEVNTIGKDRLLLAEGYLKQRLADDAACAESHRLMAAVTAGDEQAVRDLVREGAAVDERYPVVNGFNDAHTPLLVAAREGHTAIVRRLLDAGADVNATEPTFGAVPLHKSVYNGHTGPTALIAAWPGVNLDFQGATNGYTPLHDAIWHGYEECARIVLDAGARRDLVGHDGKRPVDLAAEVFGRTHALTAALRG
jgi:ankyrin repeat protein